MSIQQSNSGSYYASAPSMAQPQQVQQGQQRQQQRDYFPDEDIDVSSSSDDESTFLGFSFSSSTWGRRAKTADQRARGDRHRGYKKHFSSIYRTTNISAAGSEYEHSHRPNRMGGCGIETSPLLADLSSPHVTARMIDKDTGDFRIKRTTGRNMFTFYLFDPFHTLVDAPWYRIGILVLVLYLSCFCLFGGLYMAFTTFCEHRLPTYADAFLMSLQVHMTIGYGFYENIPTTECPGAVTIVTAQSIIALVMNAILFGLIYAKFSRPSLRKQTLWFSRNAVITDHNGKRSFIFRIANIRKSDIIEARVRLLLGYAHKTKEGAWEYQFVSLPMSTSKDALLAIPWTVIHRINKSSPLYHKTLEQLRELNIEIICFVDGINAETGNSFQKRYSYIADEIVFDGRFVTILSKNLLGQWVVDFERFHDIVHSPPVDEPPKQQQQPKRSKEGGADERKGKERARQPSLSLDDDADGTGQASSVESRFDRPFLLDDLDLDSGAQPLEAPAPSVTAPSAMRPPVPPPAAAPLNERSPILPRTKAAATNAPRYSSPLAMTAAETDDAT